MPAPDVETFNKRSPDRPLLKTVFAPQESGDRGVMVVLEPVLKFGHVIDGFTNRQVVKLTSRLHNEDYTTRQATYDLMRLRRKGLISRLSPKQRYQLTRRGGWSQYCLLSNKKAGVENKGLIGLLLVCNDQRLGRSTR
jgi:hypothetical protein